jgi:hypothetical protein
MKIYNEIRTAAFTPVPGAQPFTGLYYALAFPRHWRQAILDLYRYGKKNPDKHEQVPIGSLNAAIRAIAPDLVSVAKKATVNDDLPWLYTTSKYPASILKRLTASWLYTLQPSPEAYPLLRDTLAMMDVDSLDWDLMSVNLTEQTLTPGGTADPASHLYHLLPDVLAARIEKLPPYEYCGHQVNFRQVAAVKDGGAELISWPPLEHMPKPRKKGHAAKTWHYSGTIKVTLQTVPFSPIPRIHLTTGIRRWARGELWPAEGDTAGVHLLAQGPWLAGAEESARIATARLKVRHGRNKETSAAWVTGGPEGILSRLEIVHAFPEPEALARDAESWLQQRDGVIAVVTHHPAMGYHGVGTGLMPSERQRLTEWAAQALEPEFKPAPDLRRCKAWKANPKPQLQGHEPVPREKKNATPEEIDKNIAERNAARTANEEIDKANAQRRRQRLARAVSNRTFSCHLLWQTPEVRDQLIRAAERSLNLAGQQVSSATGALTWQTPELEVRIHTHELGAGLGGPLRKSPEGRSDNDTVPRTGRETQLAIQDRRHAVHRILTDLAEESQVVLVELKGKDDFRPSQTDPKFAIRLGCADAGRVSQFITPQKTATTADVGTVPDDDEEESDLEHRATAAWGDALRQVGMSFVPQHTVGPDAIPEKLNQLAFWIVRRNAGRSTRNSQFTPIAILLRPDQDVIMGRMPGMQGWLPYPDLLKRLTGQIRPDDLKYADRQMAENARFIRQVLYGLRGEPTLVLTHAQNERSSWEWLKNSRLVTDKIRLGDGPVQELSLHGRHLRLIRVRDNKREETAQWWAHETDELAGISKGLWEQPDADDANRIFYSTSEKGTSHTKKQRDDTKLTPHIKMKTDKQTGEKTFAHVMNTGRNAWNPALLEISLVGLAARDRPEAWAMYTHQQRFPDDYRDALALPLALHLAKLATEYALPHELTEGTDDQGGEESDDESEDQHTPPDDK